jgi:hypothetical protein
MVPYSILYECLRARANKLAAMVMVRLFVKVLLETMAMVLSALVEVELQTSVLLV